jgi:hypothetical protein
MVKPCVLIFAWLLLFFPVQPCYSESSSTDFIGVADFQVKAAYLYKFISYIEWPPNTFPNADSPLTIGIRGADTMANELSKIVATHSINGRPVIVRKLASADTLAGINILFVGIEHRETYAEIMASAKGLPILTVTESEDALSRGSMINFLMIDGRVRFEAAPKAAKQCNLTISARLLGAAYRIVGEAS